MNLLHSIAFVLVTVSTSGAAKFTDQIDWREVREFVCSFEPDRPWKIVLLHFADAQTGEFVSHMMESRQPNLGDRRPYAPTTRLFRLEKHWPIDGTIFWYWDYRPVELKGVRTPPDTLTVIDITMHRGDSAALITGEEAWLCCLDTTYYALEDILPHNTIQGTMTAGSNCSPVSRATILCEETGEATQSDDSGRFSLSLGKHKTATVHAWRPLQDSIQFKLNKTQIRSSKEVNICFLRSDLEDTQRQLGESDQHILLVGYDWFSGSDFLERRLDITVFPVPPAIPFVFSERWTKHDCLPFRLIKVFPRDSSMVQFLDSIGMHRAVSLSPPKHASVTLILEYNPNYTPRNTLNKSLGQWRAQREAPSSGKADSLYGCGAIRAEVERVHLQNYFTVTDGDYAAFVKALSPEFAPSDKSDIAAANPQAVFAELRTRIGAKRPLSSVFDYGRCEIYVHNICGEYPYERYIEMMQQAGLKPRPGDVYVRFPYPEGSYYSDAFILVYRKEADEWKIVCK